MGGWPQSPLIGARFVAQLLTKIHDLSSLDAGNSTENKAEYLSTPYTS
jgi:hypothetical protein